MAKGDRVLLTTRPPLDDWRHDDRKRLPTVHTLLEGATFSEFRKYFEVCARSHVCLRAKLFHKSRSREFRMHPVLREYLSPYSKVDFVFPSLLRDGKGAISASIFVRDHLRAAVVSVVGVLAKGSALIFKTCGISLCNWLVNKRKVDSKTVQGMFRHGDVRGSMNLYTQNDRDEKEAAQGAFLSAVGAWRSSSAVNSGSECGWS